jgi:hypothetical protein
MLKNLAYSCLIYIFWGFLVKLSYAQVQNADIKRVAVLELEDNSKGLVSTEERLFKSV